MSLQVLTAVVVVVLTIVVVTIVLTVAIVCFTACSRCGVGWPMLFHTVEVYCGETHGWQLLAHPEAIPLLPTKPGPWYESLMKECTQAVPGVDINVVQQLFGAVVELRGLTKKLETELVPQWMQLCVQLASCGCTAQSLCNIEVTDQRRCVLSFLIQCVAVGTLCQATSRTSIEAVNQSYNAVAATSAEFGVAELCADLGFSAEQSAAVAQQFPQRFPTSGHPWSVRGLKLKLETMHSQVHTKQQVTAVASAVAQSLAGDSTLHPDVLCNAIGVTDSSQLQQLKEHAVPDLNKLESRERIQLSGTRERIQQLLKDMLAPLTYCWFHVEFEDAFLNELCKSEYFIGKSVAPHMTIQVHTWDPRACIQLQLVPILERVFKPRYHNPKHYETLKPHYEHCLELGHLSAHQPHMVTPVRVVQLLQHTREIVPLLAEAVQHASVAPEIEDSAVAEFVQSQGADTAQTLVDNISQELDQIDQELTVLFNAATEQV